MPKRTQAEFDARFQSRMNAFRTPDMKPFDIIDTDGYDIVATAAVFEGGGPYNEAIVLNNNSSVYIVAMRYMQSPRASVRSIFSYDSDVRTTLDAYRAALRDMIHCALTN